MLYAVRCDTAGSGDLYVWLYLTPQKPWIRPRIAATCQLTKFCHCRRVLQQSKQINQDILDACCEAFLSLTDHELATRKNLEYSAVDGMLQGVHMFVKLERKSFCNLASPAAV